MKITLARALKEKNRLAGEIARIWSVIARENSKREDIERIVDVAEMYKKVRLYTEKLIELKTKIGIANAENLQRIYRMEECKGELSRLQKISTDETPLFQMVTDSTYKEYKRTVVFTASQVWEWQQQLQDECNRLQDEMDAFNASAKVEFETPLGR